MLRWIADIAHATNRPEPCTARRPTPGRRSAPTTC